jgi:hypothetical protein
MISPTVTDKVIDVPILIGTSNLFLPMLKSFSYLFNKFWSKHQPVIFLGYDRPNFDLPENFSFRSMGQQRGVSYWAEDIRPVVESIESDYFIYTAEDQFLTKDVNFSALEDLLKVTHEDPLQNPARIALTNTVSNQSHELLCKVDGREIVAASQSANYRASLIWSIWRKDYFLKHLHPSYSPWNFEVNTMSTTKFDGELIIGCNQEFPLGHCNAVQTMGNVNGFNFNTAKLNFEDVTTREQLPYKHIEELLNLGHITKGNLNGK